MNKELLSDDALAKIQTDHVGTRLVHCRHAGSEAVFRSPDRALWKLYTSQQRDDNRKAQANDVLLSQCRIYPGPGELEAIFNDMPGLIDTWAQDLMRSAGFAAGGGEYAKKL